MLTARPLLTLSTINHNIKKPIDFGWLISKNGRSAAILISRSIDFSFRTIFMKLRQNMSSHNIKKPMTLTFTVFLAHLWGYCILKSVRRRRPQTESVFVGSFHNRISQSYQIWYEHVSPWGPPTRKKLGLSNPRWPPGGHFECQNHAFQLAFTLCKGEVLWYPRRRRLCRRRRQLWTARFKFVFKFAFKFQFKLYLYHTHTYVTLCNTL